MSKKYISFGTLGFIVLIATLLLCVVFFFMFGDAKLSDETNELVNDLRWKHYGYGTLTCDSINVESQGFDYEWWSITFDNGILYVTTQDGKWFIEMEKKMKGGKP